MRASRAYLYRYRCMVCRLNIYRIGVQIGGKYRKSHLIFFLDDLYVLKFEMVIDVHGTYTGPESYDKRRTETGEENQEMFSMSMFKQEMGV